MNKNNFFSTQKLLKKLISFALYDIMKNNHLGYFSVSQTQLNKQKNSLKVFLIFVEEEKKAKETVEMLNKKYVHQVKTYLFKTSNLFRTPWIKFFLDTHPETEIFLEQNNSTTNW